MAFDTYTQFQILSPSLSAFIWREYFLCTASITQQKIWYSC
jgi:hypothetical protein